MAEHADGSIIVDTEIDAEGFKAGTEKIHKAIGSLNNKMKNLGPTFQKALSGNAGAVSSFDAKAAVLESTISEIESQMRSLGSTNVPTDDYQWLTTEIEKAKDQLMNLEEKQIKMDATGVKKNSKAWQSLQYDIDLAKRKISDYEGEQASMRADGTAFQSGANTAEYAKLSSALTDAKTRLAEMQSQAKKAAASTRALGAVGKTLKTTFSKMGSTGQKAISGISKKLSGLVKMFSRMLIFKIIMAVINSVTEGFKNLSQYSTQTNADLSALKSSLTQLKNSFAAAFAPILTVVTPALTKLIGYLSTAITYVGKFVAALTGAKTFTQAKAVQEDYAASLGETGKAAKNAQKQLAGFDELNILSKDSSDSSSSSGSVDPSEMFEEVPIESSITDFVSRIKDTFKNGDYASIGGVIAQGFNAAIDKLHDVFTDYDWPGLAAGLVQGLNGFVRGVDWGKLGTTLSTGIRTAIATLRSAITTFDWAALGKGVADGLNSIDWVGILSDLAAGISDILKGALDLLIGFAENLDWAKLGSDLWNGLIGIITNIDWSGIIAKAFQLLGAALAGAVSLIVGFAKSLWESLKSAFESTKNYFASYIDAAGGDVIKGLLNGIWNGIKNIGTWIKDKIFTPFINGFKNAFGIHSPSTVMAEMGGYLIEGLLQGIKNLWSTITSFFSNALASLKQTISNAWSAIQQGAQTAWQGISTTVSNAWNGIKSGVSSACTAVGSAVSTAWNGIKSGASAAWSAVSSTVSNAWSGIKSGVSSACTAIQTTASNAWNSIKTNTTTAWNAVKSGVSTALEGAKTAASTAWNSIKSTASSICSSVKSTVSSAWSNVKSSVTNSVNNLKSAASTAWNSVKSTVSSVSSSIKSTVSSAWENTKSTVSSKLSSIKSTVTSTFTSLKSSATTWGKDVCDNMANGISKAKSTVESAVKGVADKIKSFLGFSEPEDGPLSNFHTYMPDMIDLMTYGIKKNQGQAIGAVSDMASAISNEIQNGDYSMGGVSVGKNASSALTGFSDKITDGFASLMDRLQAIADGVTFATPAIATGTILPYKMGSQIPTNTEANKVTEFSADVDERLADLSYQLKQIITIIQTLNLNIDIDALTDAITQQQRTNLRNYGGM